MPTSQITENLLAKLREICLAYPEAVEDNAGVGSPGFKVRKKIFAMHHGSSRTNPAASHGSDSSLWCKAPPGVQQILVASAPEQFFVPPYVGHNGWVGIWLDRKIDWEQLAELVEESYCMTAPKRLVAQIKPKG
jgi:hypothetical protein